MRYELIVAGATLLACALSVKALWEKTPLARLALSFNVLWAVLVAFHVSGPASGMVAGLLAGFEDAPLEAAGFWVAFILAAMPGWAFLRWGLRDSPADMPAFFERTTGVVGTAAVALILPCLVIMTVGVLPALFTVHVLTVMNGWAVLYFTIQSFFEHQAYGAIVAAVYGRPDGGDSTGEGAGDA